ncbi:hypothetical protein Scep_021042 [Stephania cephalantha]|uniref:Pentatricopeptide repeat-containing protein n=1 Tax=Stephania cephalantha TaxID=152367 RepID=A0AAP0FA23_9MAGN
MHAQQILCLLNACIASKSLWKGKVLHQKIVCVGLQSNIFFAKNLINLYIACHEFESAELVFRSADNPLDVSLWNGVISAYTKNQLYNETLHVFERLKTFPYLKPDEYTYPSVLKACGGLGNVNEGKKIHALVVKSGFQSDVVVASSLVGLYAKCDLSDSALRVFDEMSRRDIASWNAVISCCYQNGQPEKALELYEEMGNSGFEPDSVTFTVVLSACARLLDLKRGREIHEDLMRSGFQLDPYINSALVDLYGKCGCLDMAKAVFEQMPRKSVVSCNSMMASYSSNGDIDSCLEVFHRMNKEGLKPTASTVSSLLVACSKCAKPYEGKALHGFSIRNRIEGDMFVHNSLINLYFRCGLITMAERVFKRTLISNIVCWNVMISGYVMTGCYMEALGIFSEMEKSSVRPDAVTFTSVLSACSQLAALERGRDVHQLIIENKLESNEIVMAALLDMYAKCGAVEDARRVFNQLLERDFVSWTSMITAYGSHGRASEALQLFYEMEQSKAKPDGVTFLAVLSACSHAGMIDEGLHCFKQMTTRYGIKPALEHYSCLIDLLGRFGKLREAYMILQSTTNMRMDVDLLSTLFSACNMHGDLDLGVEIAELLCEKDPTDASTYIGLSNLYASVGRWKDVRRIRLKMKELRLKKNPGCSWIEIDKGVHCFYIEDKSHPEAVMIYDCSAYLKKHMDDDELLLVAVEN